jgi:hypothetical protein
VPVGPEGLVLVYKGIEGDDQALLGMSAEMLVKGGQGGTLAVTAALLGADGDLGGAASSALLGHTAEHAGEVEVAATDAAAAGAITEDAISGLDVLEGMATVGADEGIARDVLLEVVVGVELLEEELARAVVGARLLSSLGDHVSHCDGVAFDGRRVALPAGGSPDAQEGDEEERDGGTCEVGAAEQW